MEIQNGTSSRGKWLVLAAALLGWMFDGFEMGLFPAVAPKALESLVPDAGQRGTWNQAIGAVFLIGAAAGGLLFGWLGDRIGRVRAMTFSVAAYSLFSGLCCLVQTPLQFAGLRFLAALGMGGEWALGVALVMEVWPADKRPLLAGLIGMASNVGFLLIALIGRWVSAGLTVAKPAAAAAGHEAGAIEALPDVAGTALGSVVYAIFPDTWAAALVANSGWRLLLLIGAFPALLTFFIRIFVPESERWKQAAAAAPPVGIGDIFKRGIVGHTLIGLALASLALIGTWASIQNLPHVANALSKGTPENADARFLAQICQSGGAIVGTFAAALLAQMLNRRLAYFALCLGSLAVCLYLFNSTAGTGAVAAAKASGASAAEIAAVAPAMGYGGLFLFWCFAAGVVTASFYGWLPLYLPELFPTRLRATAQGFAFNGGRILSAVTVFATGPLIDHFGGDYARMAALLSWLYLIGLGLIWLAPETKGRPLPE